VRQQGTTSMYRSSLMRLALLGAALFGGAMPAQADTWAEALFDNVVRDFGAAPRGSVLTHHFRIANRTKTPVRISSIRVSCGCVSAQAIEGVIAPGKDSAILITMDTRRFQNSKTVTVYVQFDQPHFEEVRLYVQANSRDDIAVLPESLAFGKIKRGVAPVVATTLSFLSNGQVEINKLRCDSNYVTLAVKELRRGPGEVAYQLSARLRPDAPPGKWYSDVWVFTNDANFAKVCVPLTVEIEAPAARPKPPIKPGAPAPPTVSMGMLRPGDTIERKVILRGASPFRITSISGTDEEVRVRETTGHLRHVHVLTVTLRPANSGLINRTLRIRTDQGKGNEIEFQAKAQVIP